jgi:hypothetical protein
MEFMQGFFKAHLSHVFRLFLLGVEFLPQGDAQLLAETLEGFEVLLVLILVLDLGLDACFI